MRLATSFLLVLLTVVPSLELEQHQHQHRGLEIGVDGIQLTDGVLDLDQLPSMIQSEGWRNLTIIEKSEVLRPVCASLDGVSQQGGGANALPPLAQAVIVAMIAAQPNCNVTCNQESDAYFSDICGHIPSPGNVYNTVSLSQVNDKLEALFNTLGNVTVATNEQRTCIMDWEDKAKLLGTENEDLFYAAYITNYSTFQFAPTYNAACDRQLGSAGLFFDEDRLEVQSLCNPDSPGLLFNNFALNGSFTRLYEYCGYEFAGGLNYWQTWTQGVGCYAVLTAGICQLPVSQSGGNVPACYCTIEKATGLRCPMFGPIYYMNVRVLGLLGGPELIGRMPGNRVTCHTNGTNGAQDSSCSNMCDVVTLQDFSECKDRALMKLFPVLVAQTIANKTTSAAPSRWNAALSLLPATLVAFAVLLA